VDSETVVLCYPVADQDFQKIESAFPGARIVRSNQTEIGRDILDATIYCGHAKLQQIDWPRVVARGRLKWIQSSAAGLDHCLDPRIVQSSVVVSGCSGLFANQVCEQTLALLFAMIRRVPQFVLAQSDRCFQRQPTDNLHGRPVGIVGFGGNGRRIAATLQNIAGSILATDMFPEFVPPDYVKLFPATEMNRLFECCDVVIVTLPLTSRTYQSIGAEQFSRMRTGSYFVNVARGSVVDQPALIEAVQSGYLAYAGLDVLDPEPPPADDPIWSCRNILITPHVGAQSFDRLSLTTELFCRNAERFFSGEILLNQVDKNLEFPRPEHRIMPNQKGEWSFRNMV